MKKVETFGGAEPPQTHAKKIFDIRIYTYSKRKGKRKKEKKQPPAFELKICDQRWDSTSTTEIFKIATKPILSFKASQ